MANKHLSNTEWGLLVAALATIDLTMFLLDFTGVGEFLDPFVDSFVAMSLPFYLHMRGQDMGNSKRLAGAIITWLTGLLSDGVLDFWWADGLYYWSLDRADEELEKVTAQKEQENNVVEMQKNQNSGIKKAA